MGIGIREMARTGYRCKKVKSIFVYLLFIFSGGLLLANNTVLAESLEEPPSGTYDDQACIQCHQKKNSQLISDWQQSAHGTRPRPATCTDCHGKTHTGALDMARQNNACIACHGGPKAPVVHSYATSKHGLILHLEARKQGWSQPLLDANYRTPGCAYCHMHRGDHNVGKAVRKSILDTSDRQAVEDDVRMVCQDCHSPRYVTRLFDNGEKMLEIGRKKLREATKMVEQVTSRFTEDELAGAHQQMDKMQHHLKNVYLGVAHQSPDYQWWHGQPALDGDLLRIKGQLDELQRIQAISDTRADDVVRKTGSP